MSCALQPTQVVNNTPKAWTFFIAYYPHINSPNKATFMNDSKKYKALTSSYPAEMSRSSFTTTISPHTSKKNAALHLSACKPKAVCLLMATLSSLHPTHQALTTNTAYNTNANPSPLPTNPCPPPYFTNLPIPHD
jgi:hypothetical protein